MTDGQPNFSPSVRKALTAAFNTERSAMPPKTGNKTMDRLSTALWLSDQAKDWYDKAKERHRRETTWSISVEDSDSVYREVQAWLVAQIPVEDHKNITATTQTVSVNAAGDIVKSGIDDYFEPGASGNRTRTQVVVSLNNHHEQKIVMGGHEIKVRFTTRNEEEGIGNDSTRPMRRGAKAFGGSRIVFEARSIAGQEAVIATLNAMVENKGKRLPALWVADSWGSWRSQDAPQRKISSVILAEGVKEDLLADLQKFLDDEPKYNEIGIPWHRGYLFHGPPGTGKTSLIKAIAAELGLDLWYAPLGDMKEDSSLVDLVRSVKARGILLLEDVDAYEAARDRDAEDEKGEKTPGGGISNSALFNALDGVVTPHGLITIMTTNHLDKLDPALVRSGRADRVIHLDLPGWTEIQALWGVFFPLEEPLSDDVAKAFVSKGLSQAEISEILKRKWDFPDQARAELMELLSV